MGWWVKRKRRRRNGLLMRTTLSRVQSTRHTWRDRPEKWRSRNKSSGKSSKSKRLLKKKRND